MMVQCYQLRIVIWVRIKIKCYLLRHIIKSWTPCTLLPRHTAIPILVHLLKGSVGQALTRLLHAAQAVQVFN